jgi:hypothetical protein
MAGDCRCLFQHSIPEMAQGNHENLIQDSSWVRVPMKMVSVGWKLSTTEERRQD